MPGAQPPWMINMLKVVAALSLAIGLPDNAANATPLALPTPKEATQAFIEMMDFPELATARLKLGTCIPAVQAEYPDQVACTAAVTLGAGTSETQVDFYHDGSKWVAQPSNSQDQLPFPDPKL